MESPTAVEPPSGIGAAVYIGALSLLLLVWGLVGRWARRRQLQRSLEWKTIIAIACQLAFDRRQAEVHAVHFGLALTLDPRARLALAAIGADGARLRQLYESRVAELPSTVEGYRATQPTSLAYHASSRQLLAQLAKHPAITIRTWLVSALLDRELGPPAKRCGASLAAALNVSEQAAPRAGDVVIESAPFTSEGLDAVTDLFADVLALDRFEAKVSAVALHCRGSVRLPSGSSAVAEQIERLAGEKNVSVTARYITNAST